MMFIENYHDWETFYLDPFICAHKAHLNHMHGQRMKQYLHNIS